MIEILRELNARMDEQTEAIGIVAREQAGATEVFAQRLGELSANVELILGQVKAIGKRLGVTEAEIEDIKAARLADASKRNGNGSGDAE